MRSVNLYLKEYYSRLLESEDVQQIITKDKSIEYFFPSLYNDIKGSIEVIFPLLTNNNKDEEEELNSKLIDLKTSIYTNNMVSPNAYTLPSIKTIGGSQFISLASLVDVLPATLIYSIYGLYVMSQNPLTAKLSNGKIRFNNNGNINVLMWNTRGLKDVIKDPNIRRGIYLHEIGHWVNYKPHFIKLLLQSVIPLAPVLAIPCVLLGIVYARSAEWKADAFAKSVGYGKELADALDIMSYSVRKNANLYVKLNDYIKIFVLKLQNIVDQYIPLYSHPSTRKRTKVLREDFSQLNENIIVDIILPFVKKGLTPLDNLISENLKLLFPLTRKK